MAQCGARLLFKVFGDGGGRHQLQEDATVVLHLRKSYNGTDDLACARVDHLLADRHA